jgi:predicted lipid-binding transport protein (Tim44 family)
VVSDDGTHQAGNENEPRQITLIWTLELTDNSKAPWRLFSSTNPAQGIPGWSLD